MLYAFDYAVNSNNGFCPITTFWRRDGEDKLEVIRNRATASIHLPASENDAKRIHVIFKRALNCDHASRNFLIGAMDWEPATNDLGTIETAHNQPAIVTAARTVFQNAGGAIRQFVSCNLTISSAPAVCAQSEFISVSTVHAEAVSTTVLDQSSNMDH